MGSTSSRTGYGSGSSSTYLAQEAPFLGALRAGRADCGGGGELIGTPRDEAGLAQALSPGPSPTGNGREE